MNVTGFGAQEVRTRVYHVLPEEEPRSTSWRCCDEARAELGAPAPAREEAWVL